jgi:hypothetical protein
MQGYNLFKIWVFELIVQYRTKKKLKERTYQQPSIINIIYNITKDFFKTTIYFDSQSLMVATASYLKKEGSMTMQFKKIPFVLT